MLLNMKPNELWKTAGIIFVLLFVAIVGYYIVKPSACEDEDNCSMEYFTSGKDYTVEIKKIWNTLLKTGTNYMVKTENPANVQYIIHQIPDSSNLNSNSNSTTNSNTSSSISSSSLSIPINPIRNSYFQINLMIQNDLSPSNEIWHQIVQIVQYHGPNKSRSYIPNKQIYSNEVEWTPKNEKVINNNPWYSLQILFKMADTAETLQSPYYMTIELPQNATYQSIIVESVKPIKNIIQSFPEWENIKMFFDSRIPESYNGNGTLWRNLINQQQSFQWSNKPFWSNGSFHLGSSQLKLVGQSSNLLTKGVNPEDVEFTMIWNYQQNAENDSSSRTLQYIPFITFYGNQKISLEVHIPNMAFHPIQIICADKLYTGNISYDPTLMNTYILSYKNKKIKIWIHGRKVFDQMVKIPYMNSRKFEINAKKSLNGILQTYIQYDKSIQPGDIPNIINSLDNYPSLYHELETGKTILNIFKPLQNENKGSSSMGIGGRRDNNTALKCPQINFNKDTAEYEIYMDQSNPYNKEHGQIGVYFSSPNKQEVLQKYIKNFVGCPVPDILHDRPITKNCPFRQNPGKNPCYQRACFNTNWNFNEIDPEYSSRECGVKVDEYCKKNYTNEPICSCWDPIIKTPQCMKMRGLVLGKMGKVEKQMKMRSLYPTQQNPQYPDYMRK
jgi:hypothetical protein